MNNSESEFGHKLSARLYYNLTRHNILTKEQVLAAYIKGDLLKLRNFGKVSHNEVFDWLDKEIDSKHKPTRFAVKQNKTKTKPLSPFQKQLRSMGRIMNELSELRSEMQAFKYALEEWTRANYNLHRSIQHSAIERKYINPTILK
jgi:hypothetical protein